MVREASGAQLMEGLEGSGLFDLILNYRILSMVVVFCELYFEKGSFWLS